MLLPLLLFSSVSHALRVTFNLAPFDFFSEHFMQIAHRLTKATYYRHQKKVT